MKRIGNRLIFLVVLPSVFLLSGCSDRMDLHQVTGTVRFEDDSIPQGEMATITFVPMNSMEGKGASSNIESDGSLTYLSSILVE